MRAKAELATLRAEHAHLVDVVHQYLASLDDPRPDYNMRRILRGWLRDLTS